MTRSSKPALPPRDATRWPILLPLLGFYLPLGIWIGELLTQPAGEPLVDDPVGPILAVTTGIAAGGALGAVVFGAIGALFLESWRVRGRATLIAILLAPFLLPSVVVTNAINSLFADGPLVGLVRGAGGAIFISTIQMAPLVLWGLSRSLQGLPAAERRALVLVAGPAGRWRFHAARAWPELLRLGGLAFLLLFPRLEVPLYAGVETFGVRIMSAFTAQENDRQGMLLVGLSALVVVPLFGLVGSVLRRQAASPLGEPRLQDETDVARWPTVVAWGTALAMAVPLVTLANLAMRPAPGSELQQMHWALAREVVRALVIAVPLAWLGWRLAEARRPGAAFLFVLPLLLPGSLAGLAINQSIQHHLPSRFVDLPILLSIAQACRFAGVAYVFGAIARDSVPAAERDALRLLVSRRRRPRVLASRVLGVLATGVVALVVLILGEVEIAIQLVPPGYDSPALQLHQFLHFRFDEQAAQFSLALATVCTLLALTLGRIGRGLR